MNPVAINNARKLGLVLHKSNRKGKKYYIINPINGHKVHFGSRGESDFTIHHDPVRRLRYRKRHMKILAIHPITKKIVPAYTIKYSPSWLSLKILW